MSAPITRRSALAGIAVAAVATPAASVALDPIFAAIERHKAATAAYDAASDIQDQFEAHLEAAYAAGT